jgi:hypothetical protein
LTQIRAFLCEALYLGSEASYLESDAPLVLIGASVSEKQTSIKKLKQTLFHAHVRPCTWAVVSGAKRIKKIM